MNKRILVLSTFGIRTSCVTAAVQDTREYVEGDNCVDKVNTIFETLFNERLVFQSKLQARLCAQYAVSLLFDDERPDNTIIDTAKSKTKSFMENPKNAFIYATVDNNKEESDHTQVVIKANGKIKKGGKQIKAKELYIKHVIDNKEPVNGQQFIQLLMKKLDMSKAGATTYTHNLKKELGAPDNFSQRKGRLANLT